MVTAFDYYQQNLYSKESLTTSGCWFSPTVLFAATAAGLAVMFLSSPSHDFVLSPVLGESHSFLDYETDRTYRAGVTVYL